MTLSKKKLAVILILFFLATLYANVYLRSAAEYKIASDFYHSDREKEAFIHYDLTVRWYLPFNPYPPKALKAMWEIGSGWDEEGETESALEAYRDLRGAIQGIRGVYKPYGEWLPKVNDRIARLEANLELRATDKKGDSPDPGTTVSPGSSVEKESRAHFETLRRESLERLDKDLAPSTGWSLMVEIGFFGWILCAVLLIVSMNVGSKERRVRMAFIWGVLLCVLFALWLLGMVNA